MLRKVGRIRHIRCTRRTSRTSRTCCTSRTRRIAIGRASGGNSLPPRNGRALNGAAPSHLRPGFTRSSRSSTSTSCAALRLSSATSPARMTSLLLVFRPVLAARVLSFSMSPWSPGGIEKVSRTTDVSPLVAPAAVRGIAWLGRAMGATASVGTGAALSSAASPFRPRSTESALENRSSMMSR